MDVERKIYSSWAFTNNEKEKAQINAEIYNELKSKYRISFSDRVYNSECKCVEPIHYDNYDLVLICTVGYARNTFKILKNTTDLSLEEIVLICDHGNLCFGYSATENTIDVYTD